MTNTVVYHKDLVDSDDVLFLNTANGAFPYAVQNDTRPSSSTISVQGNVVQDTNASGNGIIAYAWNSIGGYSAFNIYEGSDNESSVYVNLGFRPAFIMIKCINNATEWFIYDSTRDPNNQTYKYMRANNTAGENVDTTDYPINIFANGFEIHDKSIALNSSGGLYVYAAFAENANSFIHIESTTTIKCN